MTILCYNWECGGNEIMQSKALGFNRTMFGSVGLKSLSFFYWDGGSNLRDSKQTTLTFQVMLSSNILKKKFLKFCVDFAFINIFCYKLFNGTSLNSLIYINK